MLLNEVNVFSSGEDDDDDEEDDDEEAVGADAEAFLVSKASMFLTYALIDALRRILIVSSSSAMGL